MTREDILKIAVDIVNGEREQQYGKAEDNFALDSWVDIAGYAACGGAIASEKEGE